MVRTTGKSLPSPPLSPPGVYGRGSMIVATLWCMIGISTLFIAARLYTRFRILNRLVTDDYVMAVSLVLCYIFNILITVSVYYGLSRHANSLSTENLRKALLYSTAAFCPGILGFTVPKLGIVALLIHLMNPDTPIRVFLWSFVGGTTVFTFGCVIILYAQCKPSKAVWTPDYPDPKCWPPEVLTYYSYVAGALSASVDLFLAMYPATVIWRLQLHWKKKLGLTFALGLGVWACAVSIYKTTRLSGLVDVKDFTYGTADIHLWTGIEANTIIIASCVPTITPLLDRVFGKRFLGSDRSDSVSRRPSSSYLRRSGVSLCDKLGGGSNRSNSYSHGRRASKAAPPQHHRHHRSTTTSSESLNNPSARIWTTSTTTEDVMRGGVDHLHYHHHHDTELEDQKTKNHMKVVAKDDDDDDDDDVEAGIALGRMTSIRRRDEVIVQYESISSPRSMAAAAAQMNGMNSMNPGGTTTTTINRSSKHMSR